MTQIMFPRDKAHEAQTGDKAERQQRAEAQGISGTAYFTQVLDRSSPGAARETQAAARFDEHRP